MRAHSKLAWRRQVNFWVNTRGGLERPMRYAWFEFENFKGIRRARLELSSADSAARVYTLVGLNESGKTTVLEAIDQFQPTSEDEVSPKQLGGWAAPDPDSLIPVARRTNFNGQITINCGIELDDQDERDARAYMLRETGYRLDVFPRAISITDKYEYESSRFTKRGRTWTGLRPTGRPKNARKARMLTSATDPENWSKLASFLTGRLPTIWYFPNFLFNFPDKIYLEERQGESESNRFYRALFQDILDALDNDLDVQKHVVNRYRSDASADEEHLEQVLLEAGRHVATTVVTAWNRIFGEKALSVRGVRIVPGATDPEEVNEAGEPLPPRVYVQFRLEDSDGFYAVRERSLGFRWFFVYMLLTTYRGRRRGASDEMLFLFDEPASNLHPSAQGALLTSLGDLSREAVVVYTTHSHHLIDPTWLGTTFVVANRGLGADAVSGDYSAQRTDIEITPYRQFVAGHPDQSHFFQPILDVLAYAPSPLEHVPEVVMVEGKSDFYLLSYYERVILERPEEECLSFLPGGGAGTLGPPIQLYLGWARPFVALLDSDRAGRDQKKRYQDMFGAVVAPYLCDLSELTGDPKSRGIESLFTDTEKLRLQRLADPEASRYNKKAMALGVQEGLVARRPVSLSKTTRNRLDAVIDGLRARLS